MIHCELYDGMNAPWWVYNILMGSQWVCKTAPNCGTQPRFIVHMSSSQFSGPQLTVCAQSWVRYYIEPCHITTSSKLAMKKPRDLWGLATSFHLYVLFGNQVAWEQTTWHCPIVGARGNWENPPKSTIRNVRLWCALMLTCSTRQSEIWFTLLPFGRG